MDIREAFNTIVSMLRENDGNFGRSDSYFVVGRRNLTHHGWRVLETAANAEGDYLDELHDVILTVTHRDDGGYLVHSRPFVWTPATVYGFTPKMFNHVFSKYDDALVQSCIKLAEDNDGMLYSEIRDANGRQRCHYGVRVYNGKTGAWDGVYEGTFPVESQTTLTP